MKLHLFIPFLIPIALLVAAGLMVMGPFTSDAMDDPWPGVPKRPDQSVSHADFFDREAFADVKDDWEAIAHRMTETCLSCHPEAADQVMHTSHWTWEGESVELPGRPGEMVTIGKTNVINNFCIAIDSNWPRCTSCHVGYGWEDATFDFNAELNVDCLVCHDGSGSYVKDPAGAGYPQLPPENPDNEWYLVDTMLDIARQVHPPDRENCGVCHFAGGGGDAVKHGDLNGFMYNPDEEMDVHMGGHDMVCIDCHRTENHEIMGRSMAVSVDPANQVFCFGEGGCHSETPHSSDRLNAHTSTVACQTCHIPEMARHAATKMTWDWSQAGDATRPAEDHVYDPKKGEFTYAEDVQPEYYWYNGFAERYVQGDPVPDEAVVEQAPALTRDRAYLNINHPMGDIRDPNARIFPFKVHRATQPMDLEYQYLLIPHLFGRGGFWWSIAGQPDWTPEQRWHNALVGGAEISGLPYSGAETGAPNYGWAATQMFWPQTHMVAPAERALQCNDCHGREETLLRLDWEALGYESGDPFTTGGRFQLGLVPEYDTFTRERWDR